MTYSANREENGNKHLGATQTCPQQSENNLTSITPPTTVRPGAQCLAQLDECRAGLLLSGGGGGCGF